MQVSDGEGNCCYEADHTLVLFSLAIDIITPTVIPNIVEERAVPVTRRLSEVIEETISTLESQGLAPASIKSARQTYDHFLGMVGNIQLKYLDTTKVDEFFLSRQQKGETHNTLNLRRNWLRKLAPNSSRKIVSMRSWEPLMGIVLWPSVRWPRRKARCSSSRDRIFLI